MPCPTCEHTMSSLGLDQAGRRSFWCGRCGTVKTESTDPDRVWEEHEAPALVARVRRLAEGSAQGDAAGVIALVKGDALRAAAEAAGRKS